MTALNKASLAGLSIPKPTYDRAKATVGIVHFGFGNFHRAHQAMYVDRLMEQGKDLDWGICGVGILPQDEKMRDAMRAQDCLYTLVLRNPDGTLTPRVVGSALEYLWGPEDHEAIYARLVDPAVRIVSLTVTEGGYLKNPATGKFDPSDPAVVHDVADNTNPRTAFAYIVEGLRRRRAAGSKPFTVLSCDNLQGNGHIAQQTVVAFARLVDAELADWIEAHVAFPNCMVDRITPATTDADRKVISENFGIEDLWPVPGEPWEQWIIEDEFGDGRPQFEAVGAQIVKDVKPYELMKLRLLNATHQAIAYWGAPLGYVLVDETLRDDRVRIFLEQYMAKEAALTLGALPGVDLKAYMAMLIQRYSNAYVRDTLVRLATDGSNRMPTFAIPAIRENLQAGRPTPLGAGLMAAWAEYWALIGRGKLDQGQIPPDVAADALAKAAIDPDPKAFLELRNLMGDLADHPGFVEQFVATRKSIVERGVHATLDSLLGL